MDLLFIEGVAAVASAVIVFCGSVFLLLAMVVGGRLAYFVTATITLAFLLMMGVVWSINPLGPVGSLPEWRPFQIGAEAAELNFAPAADYPESPWESVNTEDVAQAALASELEGAAAEYLDEAITDGTIDVFEAAADGGVNSDQTRLLQQDGTQYGAVTIAAVDENDDASVVAILEYDPGNALGPPRMITAGTFVLFALHLFGLSRSERKARRLTNGENSR
jgi:hypothetical protein